MEKEMKMSSVKPKISTAGVILAALAVILEIAALLLMRFDDAGLLYVAVFPLAGFVSYFACRKLSKPSSLGLGALCVLLLLLFPFAIDSHAWWFGLSLIMFYFALIFAFLILLGWAVGVIPSLIVKTKRDLVRKERALEIAKLTILLLIVIAVLGWILNLAFGNPVTAYIAGHEMRDWLETQENAEGYEILDGYFPSYGWYNTEYTFDLAGGGKRWVLRWNDGEIRLDNAGW